jgi:hypothetical protein
MKQTSAPCARVYHICCVSRWAKSEKATASNLPAPYTTWRVGGIKRKSLVPMSALILVSSTSPKRANPRPFTTLGAMLARRVKAIR